MIGRIKAAAGPWTWAILILLIGMLALSPKALWTLWRAFATALTYLPPS